MSFDSKIPPTSADDLRGEAELTSLPRQQPRRVNGPERVAPGATNIPAWLGPELVPGVEVVEVLPTVDDLAVFDLEDDAAHDIELFAVALWVLRWIPTTRPSSLLATSCNSALKLPPVSPANRPNWPNVASRPW